jgi:3-isopropylmalate dehydrogenase
MKKYKVAILEGEGIGHEVVGAGVEVLKKVAGDKLEFVKGGSIGGVAFEKTKSYFPEETMAVCDKVFKEGGAVYSGPGSGGFVYEMRSRYKLFCKLIPIKSIDALKGASHLKQEVIDGTDILIVRQNDSGIYFGDRGYISRNGERMAYQIMSYARSDIEKIVEAAFEAAQKRRKKLTSVDKKDGITEVSKLWREVVEVFSKEYPDVESNHMHIDNMAFQLVHNPTQFDVIVAPNLFGDMLADLGGVIVGSRGLLCSGNFSQKGFGVYQTVHGYALDIAGMDIANPLGQIYAGVMMLRNSFNMNDEAEAIENAIEQVLADGYRIFDIMEKRKILVGTREMTKLIADAIRIKTNARIPYYKQPLPIIKSEEKHP